MKFGPIPRSGFQFLLLLVLPARGARCTEPHGPDAITGIRVGSASAMAAPRHGTQALFWHAPEAALPAALHQSRGGAKGRGASQRRRGTPPIPPAGPASAKCTGARDDYRTSDCHVVGGFGGCSHGYKPVDTGACAAGTDHTAYTCCPPSDATPAPIIVATPSPSSSCAAAGINSCCSKECVCGTHRCAAWCAAW